MTGEMVRGREGEEGIGEEALLSWCLAFNRSTLFEGSIGEEDEKEVLCQMLFLVPKEVLVTW